MQQIFKFHYFLEKNLDSELDLVVPFQIDHHSLFERALFFRVEDWVVVMALRFVVGEPDLDSPKSHET